MLIRELEHETGLERATIRFYEKEGFIQPQRSENGYRRYSQEDCDTLLKIKLLRQLGMSLETIRDLQQGSGDFSDALSDQINALDAQIHNSFRAKEICREIRKNVTDYASLDARYYLDALSQPSVSKSKWEPRSVPEFHQAVPLHPWKRFFARTIDLALLDALLMFLVAVVFRIRPINGPIYTVLGWQIISFVILIPIEGLLLHYFGTTPGKWIMGIRIESVNGGNLPISVAMMRCGSILLNGYGLTIPFVSLWRQYRSYKEYRENLTLSWDREWDAEIQFDYYYTTHKKVFIGVIAAAYIFTTVWTVNDRLRTTHRGADLTLEQVTENYNELDELLAREQGTATSGTGSGNAVLIIGSKPMTNFTGPEFVTEDGFVRKIVYSAGYEDVLMLNIFNGYMTKMTMAVAMAQDWMNLLSYRDFTDQFTQAIKSENGTFIYENLEIRWKANAINCIYSGSAYYTKIADQPSSVTYTIELYIHPAK